MNTDKLEAINIMQAKSEIVNEFINHLTPGKTIDLQLGPLTGVRIKPIVIGIDLGNYILLKFPPKLNPADYKDMLILGNIVVVRYIIEGEHGECIAFSTTIEHILSVPERLIFLNYPASIENRQLRTYQREKIYLPAQISHKLTEGNILGSGINGYIVDISSHGCQFSFKAETGHSGVKKLPIYIAITLVGHDEPLLVNAHVKNNRIENGSILVGIMFDDTSLHAISLLLNDMNFNK